jgi:hypothetical protein
MSNPSIQKETGETPFYKSEEFWGPIAAVSPVFALMAIMTTLAHFGVIETREMLDARIAREVQEWRLAHKDMVSCDFGRGFKFSVESTKPADVPEALRPALTAGLANGACRLAFPPQS